MAGAMKIPDPIIDPTRMVVAEKTPRRRSRVGGPAGVIGAAWYASEPYGVVRPYALETSRRKSQR